MRQADKGGSEVDTEFVMSRCLGLQLLIASADDCDVIDWLEDIKSSVNARRMSEVERFDFVMEHLVGEAKSEMRLRFRNDRDSEKLLHAIEESYGTTDSTTSLKKEFYRRDEQETESFEEYSLALVRIADRIAQRDNQDEDSLATELK